MKNKVVLALLFIIIATLACSSSPGNPTPSAPITVVTPSAALFAPVTFENVFFAIPLGTGIGATPIKTDEVELPFINPSNGPMPQHIVFNIDGYVLPREAKILVFNAFEYSAYDELTQSIVTNLQTQPYQEGEPIPDELTLGELYAQPAPLAFQNGQGMRYIVDIQSGFAPISNNGIFYYFQGLTNDGIYFVSAELPVSIGFLPANDSADSPMPVNGIPFPSFTNPNPTTEEFNAYYAAIKERLNASSPDTFTPSLAELDKMIQSIKINP